MVRVKYILLTLFFALLSCSQNSGRVSGGPDFEVNPQTAFTINDEAKLMEGSLAIGTVGDILLEYDQIKVIIQKPGKDAGLGSFGGSIIDAGLQGVNIDHFGEVFPLINIEWTVNYYNFEVIADGSDGGAKILRAHGIIDVYDYLDLDFVADAAAGLVGQELSFSNRFDDRRDPFSIYEDLQGVEHKVVTDYILKPGKRYVQIETTLRNSGKVDAFLPVGEFISGSGELSLLIPGVGFSPPLMTQVAANTTGIIYAGYENVPVSYGLFHDQSSFIDADSEDGTPRSTTSITFSGLTGVIFGEAFLKLLPLGSAAPPEIKFFIPAGEEKKLTRYFIVGDGSAGSVMDAALEALDVPSRDIRGTVLDANGNAVENALVAIKNKGGSTVVTYRSDKDGNFKGQLSNGDGPIALTYGKGQYHAVVEKSGFHLNGTATAGECTPGNLDLTKSSMQVVCKLGESGKLKLNKAITDGKDAIPARLTIIGIDPSPNDKGGAGVFYDTDLLKLPQFVVGLKHITSKGTFDLTGKNSFYLEPGIYRLVFSHGVEYGIDERVVEIVAGEEFVLNDVVVPRVIESAGFISADFHVHSIYSPDSAVSARKRVLGAVAEGLDILQSSDHDYRANFHPAVEQMTQEGLIVSNSIKTSVGCEITPNHFGHIHAFPLEHDKDDPADGGALDWSDSDLDEVSPSPDYSMSPAEIIAASRKDPGEEVLQINHIADSPTGLPVATGWVTSAFYEEQGTPALSSYADPIERRLTTDALATVFPRPFGSSDLLTADFDAVELTIGLHLNAMESLYRTGLPTWFNLLNLGLTVTATANSDSHKPMYEVLGMPRNYVASSVDPLDGQGVYEDIDLEEYAYNINQGKLVISAGPFIQVKAFDTNKNVFSLGETVEGNEVTLEIKVDAPSWAWFDTIEIYANTEPVPIDDETGTPMEGSASDPAKFYQPYHIPLYTYQPQKTFRLIDGSLKEWENKDGKISAKVNTTMRFKEDSWIVVMARGTRETEGYQSLFPLVSNVIKDEKKAVELDPQDMSEFHKDRNVGAPAWGLANPIYVDVDGNGFEAMYVHDGRSPLKSY